MINLFITIAKYISIILVLLYTYCNFRYLSIPEQEDAEPLCRWQLRMILLVHFLMSVIILLKTWEPRAAVFYALQLLFLLLYVLFSERLYPTINRLLLNNICFFLVYGMILLERLSPEKAIKQFAVVVASATVALAVPAVLDRVWEWILRIRLWFSVLGILLLSTVLLIGIRSYGAKMSISIMGFSFQAVELVKLSFVFSMAGFLTMSDRFRDLVRTGLLAGLHIVILVLCRDLGSALVFSVTFLLMLFISSGRKRYLLYGFGAMSLAGVLSYHLFSHVRTRVFAWRDPWADISDKGYQIAQSLFAIGTGGYFGLGLFQGMPDKIPIVEKDFIFSALSEEMGAITAISVALVCLGCFIQMMVIATYMQEKLYRLIAVGLGMEYILQVFLTIGGAIKFIPSTGITLPFISYGGSSLISSFLLFSVIQALYIIQGKEDAEELLSLYGEGEANRTMGTVSPTEEPYEESLEDPYEEIPQTEESHGASGGRPSRKKVRHRDPYERGSREKDSYRDSYEASSEEDDLYGDEADEYEIEEVSEDEFR